MALMEWYKARQRGEVRIAGPGVRGRVYAKKEAVETNAGPGRIFGGRGKATLEIEVRRADGTVERMEAPVTVLKLSLWQRFKLWLAALFK